MPDDDASTKSVKQTVLVTLTASLDPYIAGMNVILGATCIA